jgi:hypothetical protein
VIYALTSVAVVLAWAAVLAHLGLFTPADVRAWRRLATMRGFARPPTRLERAAGKSAFVRRLQEELDLRRLLAIADRRETEGAFAARSAFVALLTFTLAIVVDTTFRIGGGDFLVPPWIAALLAVVAILVRIVSLRDAARRRRDRAERALGDMMMLVAIVTDGRGLQLDDAVRILARCAISPDLHTLVDGGWRRLVASSPHSTVELYRSIAVEFGMPQFARVADALTTTNVGIAERDTYTRVAHAVYEQRLAEARTRAARARILVTLPVAGMLIPLLLLLGAPTLQSITSGLGGG